MIYIRRHPGVTPAFSHPHSAFLLSSSSPIASAPFRFEGEIRKAEEKGSRDSDLTAATNETEEKKTEGKKSSVVYQIPQYQVVETGDAFLMALDLPGTKACDVDIQVDGGDAIMVGAKRKKSAAMITHYFRRFEMDGSRTEPSQATAKLSDGVLTITVPKKEAPEPMAINVANDYAPQESDNDKEHLRFSLDVPGVRLSDLKVEISLETVSVHAQRTKGRVTSKIHRSFSFDRKTVDTAAFQAFLADGVLTVIAPRKALTDDRISIPVDAAHETTAGATGKED